MATDAKQFGDDGTLKPAEDLYKKGESYKVWSGCWGVGTAKAAWGPDDQEARSCFECSLGDQLGTSTWYMQAS